MVPMRNLVIYSSSVIILFPVSSYCSDSKFVACHMGDSTSTYRAVGFNKADTLMGILQQ